MEGIYRRGRKKNVVIIGLKMNISERSKLTGKITNKVTLKSRRET